MHRLGRAPAHRAGGADQAVQAGVVDHPDDRRHPAALLAHQPAAHAVELDLRRGQRARAELVLEPLDPEAGVAALDQEARQPLRRLGEREEHVARRVGAEPLVAGDLVGAVGLRLGAGGVGADVGAALLLGHRHAGQRARVVVLEHQARLPLLGEVRVLAQRGDHRVGHRHRAHHAAVDLVPDVHQRGAHGVRAGLGVAPGQGVDAALHRLAQASSARRGRAPPRRRGCRSGRGCAARARCARSARSARAPRRSRPARRCRAGAPAPQPAPSRSTASWIEASASNTL